MDLTKKKIFLKKNLFIQNNYKIINYKLSNISELFPFPKE